MGLRTRLGDDLMLGMFFVLDKTTRTGSQTLSHILIKHRGVCDTAKLASQCQLEEMSICVSGELFLRCFSFL